ncbi:hypothetical protein GCM10027066_32210 [Dyella jejuensis]
MLKSWVFFCNSGKRAKLAPSPSKESYNGVRVSLTKLTIIANNEFFLVF